MLNAKCVIGRFLAVARNDCPLFLFRWRRHPQPSNARQGISFYLPPHIIKKYLAVTMFYFELPPTIISKIVAVTMFVNGFIFFQNQLEFLPIFRFAI